MFYSSVAAPPSPDPTEEQVFLGESDFTTASGASWSGGVLSVNSGSIHVDSKMTVARPAVLTLKMRQDDARSPECGVAALFPDSTSRHSGYNIGLGWWGNGFGVGAPGAERGSNFVHGSDWHEVAIDANADGNVYMYLNGVLTKTYANNAYTSGVVRLGNNCRNFQYKDITVSAVTVSPSGSSQRPARAFFIMSYYLLHCTCYCYYYSYS